jgi:hypothetical protein
MRDIKTSGWAKIFRLLGCYAAWGGLKQTFRDYVSVQTSSVKQSTSCSVITHNTEEFNASIFDDKQHIFLVHEHPVTAGGRTYSGNEESRTGNSSCFVRQTAITISVQVTQPPLLSLYKWFNRHYYLCTSDSTIDRHYYRCTSDSTVDRHYYRCTSDSTVLFAWEFLCAAKKLSKFLILQDGTLMLILSSKAGQNSNPKKKNEKNIKILPSNLYSL